MAAVKDFGTALALYFYKEAKMGGRRKCERS